MYSIFGLIQWRCQIMYEKDYEVKGFGEPRECGFITCIHCIAGYCNNGTCELDERLLRQED